MPRIGKYIGHKPTISASSAVGVWDLIDQNVNSREDSWPFPPRPNFNIGSSYINYIEKITVSTMYIGNSYLNYIEKIAVSTIYIGNSWVNYSKIENLYAKRINLGLTYLNYITKE